MLPRKAFKSFFVLTFVLLLSACSTIQLSNTQLESIETSLSQLLQDDVFPVTLDQIDVSNDNLFQLTTSMKAELDTQVSGFRTELQRYEALRHWVYQRVQDFDYDPSITVRIDKLDSVEKINCLSFSILFVAAARYVDVPAKIQLVYTPPNWDAIDDNWVQVQHINVVGNVFGYVDSTTLPPKEFQNLTRGVFINQDYKRIGATFRYIVDINPEMTKTNHKSVILSDNEVISRFYNNKAAANILSGKYNEAYIYNKKALLSDKLSPEAWNNLGVLYTKINHIQTAQKALLIALEIDPEAGISINNLYSNYLRLSQKLNADSLKQTLSLHNKSNPYYYHKLGIENAQAGNYKKAVELLELAIELKNDESMFYLSLAKIQMKLNQRTLALKSIEKATNVKDKRAGIYEESLDEKLLTKS